ncbi:MAG: hypothetical protein NDI91_19710 [Sulfuritalea sp.]|nr:hypothetical protein [Sulfuritalea sp.]
MKILYHQDTKDTKMHQGIQMLFLVSLGELGVLVVKDLALPLHMIAN